PDAVEDHWLVADRQQVLVGDLGQRKKTSSLAASQNDAAHGLQNPLKRNRLQPAGASARALLPRPGGEPSHQTLRAAIAWRYPAAPPGAWNTAEPATRTVAPASMTWGAVWGSMPPSTSMSTDRPRRSISARSSRIFGTTASMNFWPPKPGFTDMTRTMSS